MRLYNKDSYEFIKTIPDNSVDLILTDPPYDVSVNHDGGRLYHSKGFDKSNKDLVNANIDKGYDINYYWKEKISRISMACLKQHDIFDELRNQGIKEYTSKLQLF